MIDKDQIFNTHVKTTCGYISSETWLAFALRLLNGEDDRFMCIFDIHFDHCTRILYDVLTHWIIETYIGDINMCPYLGDKTALVAASEWFS